MPLQTPVLGRGCRGEPVCSPSLKNVGCVLRIFQTDTHIKQPYAVDSSPKQSLTKRLKNQPPTVFHKASYS